MTDHLTDTGSDLGRLAARTPPGMAYFVETGPPNRTCKECRFFLGKVKRSGIGKGEIQPGRCQEFIRMMRSKGYSNVAIYELPPDTRSCRHFELKPLKEKAHTGAA